MGRPWSTAYEPEVAPRLDYPEEPLHEFLTASARRFPKQTAIYFYGKKLSYRATAAAAARCANALRALGVRPGDRVAVMLPNSPQAVIAYYGALMAGAVVVQMNPLYVEREIEFQLADSGAETMITLDLFYPRVQSVKSKTPLKRIVVTGVRDYLPVPLKWLYPFKAKREGQWVEVPPADGVHQWTALLDRASDQAPAVTVGPDDLALLQYTGGTTGTPKGVMLTHRNLVANVVQCHGWMPSLREGREVFLGVIPFFHVYGMSSCMNLAVKIGAMLVLLPKFKTDEVLSAIQKRRVTIFMGVQAMYVAINNHPKVSRCDLSSVRICISGAGPLHAEVQERFEQLTKGKLVEGYGLTESAPVTHANPIFGKRKKGSIGIPLPDTDARIVDAETGARELEAEQVGELVVRGPQVMRGYWNRPDETAGVLRDGWLYTGDLGRMDRDGYFYIVDRKKDMIKTRGENVYPREVEEALFRHPKVKEAVVVGLPESFSVEVIKAYIVLKEGDVSTPQEIIAFCAKELAKYKVPKFVEFRSELPKTMVGKVLRRQLLEEEMQKMRPAPTGPGSAVQEARL
ncbi:MAG: long-chain fatty acid--CoA ligase [Nitrospirota bacterium]